MMRCKVDCNGNEPCEYQCSKVFNSCQVSYPVIVLLIENAVFEYNFRINVPVIMTVSQVVLTVVTIPAHVLILKKTKIS